MLFRSGRRFLFHHVSGRGLVGIFAVDLKLDYLQSQIEKFSDVENGEYSFALMAGGGVAAHSDSVQIKELKRRNSLII